MVALSRCLAAVALVGTGAEGARIARRRVAPNKFIGGVPVLNYDRAFGGQASLGDTSSTEEEWIVFVKSGTSDSQLQRMCKRNKKGCNLVGHPNGGSPFLEMRGTETDLKAVIEESGGAADFVEPDVEVHMIPGVEEGVGVQAATWGLNRIGADSRAGTGASSTIFVQDTGVRFTHGEFGSRASSSLDVTSAQAIECNGDLTCALDRQGHGTHCAGTAAGATYGVAPDASVRSIKTLSDQGSGQLSWQISGIDWVTVSETRPAVLSMSLGGSGTTQSFTVAIDAAVAAGVVVVVAGGNSNSNACNFSPAYVESAITVGSTTSNDARSSFSNFGPCTNIWAPGSDVLSSWYRSDTDTRTISGTSMACPHVSGAAALILSADPTKNAPAVLQQLLDDAFLNVISDLKFGDTNALLCVAEGGAPPTPTPQPTPAPPPGSWVVTGSGCEEDGECVQSLGHPSNYGNNNECGVTLYGDISISVESFTTEANYDILTIGGSSYSGTAGPSSGVYSGVITWTSDFSITQRGWRLCKN